MVSTSIDRAVTLYAADPNFWNVVFHSGDKHAETIGWVFPVSPCVWAVWPPDACSYSSNLGSRWWLHSPIFDFFDYLEKCFTSVILPETSEKANPESGYILGSCPWMAWGRWYAVSGNVKITHFSIILTDQEGRHDWKGRNWRQFRLPTIRYSGSIFDWRWHFSLTPRKAGSDQQTRRRRQRLWPHHNRTWNRHRTGRFQQPDVWLSFVFLDWYNRKGRWCFHRMFDLLGT